MKCPDKGIIQAYIDGELDIAARKDLENHLAGCGKCEAVFTGLKDADDFVFGKLAGYRDRIEEQPVVPAQSAAMIRKTIEKPGMASPKKSRDNPVEKKGVWNFMNKYRKFIAVACIVLVAAVCLTVQPVRAAIFDALKVFRVERLDSFSISPEEMAQIRDGLAKGEGDFTLDRLGRFGITGGKSSEATYDEAVNACGFPILLPDNARKHNPEFMVTEPSTLSFTLNVDSANQVLRSLNATELLPAEVNGKTFTADFGVQVSAKFVIDGKAFTLFETTAPNFQVPEGVDENALFNTMASIPVFPDELKARLKSINDWKSTMYIPVFNGSGNQINEISFRGTTAYVASSAAPEENSCIMWMKDGVICGVSGNTGSDELISFAQGLK